MHQTFKAGTQYNDFVGTVAADRSDNLVFADLLRKKGLMQDDEHVVGFEIVFTENDGRAVPEPGIVAFLGKGSGVDSIAQQKDGTFELRIVEVFELPLADFFAYFKRFNVMFSNKSLNLDGARYELRD